MTPALESLRRKAAAVVTLPARRDHVAYLDGWRGVCIAFVLIGHLIPAVAPLATVGVEMFFVLSGRLMAEILIFKRQPVRIFLKRRVARIIPATATFVVVTAAIMNATWWLAGRPLNWISPLGALFFFHNYIPPAAVAPAFDHMWSLAVEEHSYLALALIALLTSRKSPRIAMAAAIGLSAVALLNGLRLSLVAQGDGPLYLWRSDVRAASVLMSFAMCIALRPLIERPSRTPRMADAGRCARRNRVRLSLRHEQRRRSGCRIACRGPRREYAGASTGCDAQTSFQCRARLGRHPLILALPVAAAVLHQLAFRAVGHSLHLPSRGARVVELQARRISRARISQSAMERAAQVGSG